jgi:hypothetical protein
VLIHEHAWADLFPTNDANVSILPQVHNSKRFSASELTSYNFVFYRKCVLRVWKIYMLYIYKLCFVLIDNDYQTIWNYFDISGTINIHTKILLCKGSGSSTVNNKSTYKHSSDFINKMRGGNQKMWVWRNKDR